jgi:type I restriction enzyme S subunit
MRKGWEYKRLDECANIEYGTRVVQKKDSGTLYPVYGGGGETFRMDKFNREDCLIVARFAMSRRCVRFVNGKFFLNDSGLSVKAGDKLYQSYLNYNIISLNDDIYHLGKGAAQRNLDVKSFKKLTIAIPPQSTQLAIVSELDKINELIRLKKEQLKDFDNLAQSLFYEMFGDPVENEKGWDVKKLKDISREIGDGLHGTPEYSEVDTGCYFINGNNLENGTIVIKENTKMVSEKTKAKHYIEMDDFTILVSINGTLGKVAFYNGENVILGKSACYIKLEAYNDKKYIFELLKSDYFKRYAESECTGTTIRNVSLKSMRNFRCPLPPLPLQRLFAQRIEQIEREKSEVQKSIQDLETLLASRMQYWFE